MRITNRKLIDKYVKRDIKLAQEFNKWIKIIKLSKWNTSKDVQETFKIIFFEDNEVDILWVGNHDVYDRKFSNKKNILKFLQDKGYE